MDLTSIMGTLLGGDSVSALSQSTNTDSSQVRSVVSAALPLLMKGLAGQANDSSTAASAAAALKQHAQDDTSDIGSFFGKVDASDGAKIIGHLLGTGTESTTKDIAKKSGVDASQVASILATAAPLLMSLVGQQATSAKTVSKTAAGSAKKSTKTSSKTSRSGSRAAAEKSDDSGLGGLVGDLLGNQNVTETLGGLLGKLLK